MYVVFNYNAHELSLTCQHVKFRNIVVLLEIYHYDKKAAALTTSGIFIDIVKTMLTASQRLWKCKIKINKCMKILIYSFEYVPKYLAVLGI